MQQILSISGFSILPDSLADLTLWIVLHKLDFLRPPAPFCFFSIFDLFHLFFDLFLIELYPKIILLVTKSIVIFKLVVDRIVDEFSGHRQYLINYHNQMNSNIKMISASQQKIGNEIREIYSVLIKYGFPGLVASNVLEDLEEIEKVLQDYFQPNVKRQNLIEWLILNINTLYAQEMESKTNKKRKILNNLWKLGVLPFSKHTSNLDYQKYVQGLLGYENSINLIYNLCTFLKQSKQFDKSKQDSKFGLFLQEVINNYDNLVNLDYDPYKVSFPAAYQNLSDQEFNKEYEEVSKKISILKGKSSSQNKEVGIKTKVEVIFEEFEQNKAEFAQKYSKVIQKIQETVSNNSNLIQNYNQIQSSASRTLKISENLPKIYRDYKQKIKLAPILISKLAQERRTIQTLLQSLNENVCL